MKRWIKSAAALTLALVLAAVSAPGVFAGSETTADETQQTTGETQQTTGETQQTAESETQTAQEKHAILPNPGIVPEGVSVNGMDLAGMTYDQAGETIDKFIKDTCSGSITLQLGEDKKEIAFTDFGMAAEEQHFADDIRLIGTTGTMISQYKELADVRENKAAYEVVFKYDQDQMKEKLEEAAESFNAEVKDAELVRHSGEFILTESVVGRDVDLKKTVGDAESAMTNDWNYGSVTIDVTAEETQPKHTTEELAVITDKLGSYSTEYWGSSDNRIANIANGARLIDELIVYPGETFSFLSHVQPFSGANGYYEATGYAGGKVVPSIGGGICQVSTTLYNAVLRAELNVTQRYCHGLTVSYVPLAMDATVSEGGVDFQFVNNLKDPIYIEAYTYDGSVYAVIYGKEYRSASRTLDFVSVTESVDPAGEEVVTEDESLPEDYEEVTQWEHDGATASLYKNVYENGSLVDTVWINTSTYYSSPRYVIRGVKKDESESESDSESDSENSDADDEIAADQEAADYE